jgi:hypothetical protein
MHTSHSEFILDEPLSKQLETLLIPAHSPPYNNVHISTPPTTPPRPLRLWNVGRFWGLFPEVSSTHDWYQL